MKMNCAPAEDEGMIGAVKSLVLKSGVAITGLTGGLVLKFAGASDASQGVAPEVANTLHNLFINIQAAGLVIGIIIFIFYPITRARSEETRRLLDAKNLSK